ncbi:MAG: tRNA (adenosine(37)-N6)-threonylcarbamoyltransferase complex dimerization subunit type 1 TsaB [Ginsengibacter sp.]
MNYLLNIHTTTETAIVNLTNENELLATLLNTDSKNHAAFLHSAIHHILQENDIQPTELKAIGVTGGPGSYTGIRVGLATAKGLCFALKTPLIVVNTLEVMAFSAIEKIKDQNALYCAMIDARRAEVFTATYDHTLHPVNPPSAMILTEETTQTFSSGHPIYFFGSGSEKFKKAATGFHDFHFENIEITASALGKFCWTQFLKNKFENLTNSHPIYLKDFYTNAKKA